MAVTNTMSSLPLQSENESYESYIITPHTKAGSSSTPAKEGLKGDIASHSSSPAAHNVTVNVALEYISPSNDKTIVEMGADGTLPEPTTSDIVPQPSSKEANTTHNATGTQQEQIHLESQLSIHRFLTPESRSRPLVKEDMADTKRRSSSK